MNQTPVGKISRKITSNRFIRRSLLISAVTLAGVLLASPAMADRYRTVTVYETHRKPLVIIYGAPTSSVHIVRDSHHRRSDVYYGNYRGNSYRNSHDRKYDRNKSSSHRSYNNIFRQHDSGYGQARGSWSSGRQHDVIYVDKRGKKTSTYRQVERNSVQIRDRRR